MLNLSKKYKPHANLNNPKYSTINLSLDGLGFFKKRRRRKCMIQRAYRIYILKVSNLTEKGNAINIKFSSPSSCLIHFN